MDSGVKIDYGVVRAYEEIKEHHAGEVASDRLKLVMLRLSDDYRSIIVDDESTLRMKDVSNEDDVFKKLVSMFPPDHCRYALYDCRYRTKETDEEDLVFITWCPEDGVPLKEKMLISTTVITLKRKLKGGSFSLSIQNGQIKCGVHLTNGCFKSFPPRFKYLISQTLKVLSIKVFLFQKIV
ncbi:cofilin-1-like [Clupea harengus]|uniref:Cofilin-1-like n=1 Tax=Clupea harengus TaxID=7950 RepID=A0A8M1K6A9_CLUHA|nr:cofilin-1-like [Clupea harengus]